MTQYVNEKDACGIFVTATDYDQLQQVCGQLERENLALKQQLNATQRRLKLTLNDWQRLDKQVRNDLQADIICDFISTFYHYELVQYLKKQGLKYKSWSEVSADLSDEFFAGDSSLKKICCKIARFTEKEWDTLYDYKRTRNLRVHPQRSQTVIKRIMAEMPDESLLKTALGKMFSVIELTPH